MYIKWVITHDINQLYLPEKFQHDFSLSNKITFHFGSWEQELSVQFREDLPNDTIGLSVNVINDVFIPEDIIYELIITEDSVIVGPVILYLVTKRLINSLDQLKARLDHIIPYNGLIIASTSSGIHTKKRVIEGYYFQPRTESRESGWKKGTFPYPGAVFKRASIPQKLNDHLYDKMKGKIFNSTYFDKWEMWKWLAPNKFIRNHLPYTQKLNTVDDIKDMLDIYPSIYLKPRDGSKGKGIVQIKREDNRFYITDDKNRATKAKSLEINPVINKVLKKRKKYMVQQGVPVTYNSRNIDFRIYMQKDETKLWKCTGLIARLAKPGSITTNLSNLDNLLTGKEAFEQLFYLDKEEVEQLEQKIIDTCKNACELLDKHGCYADIAIDFILDNDFHVWILEMNKRYGYKSFFIIKDSKLFGEIIRIPFLYARALAGFSMEKKKLVQKLNEDGYHSKAEDIAAKRIVHKNSKQVSKMSQKADGENAGKTKIITKMVNLFKKMLKR